MTTVMTLGLVVPPAPPVATAATPVPAERTRARPTRAEVEKRLRASERPLSAGDLMSLGGAAAETMLVAIARDRKADPVLRARAAGALAAAVTPAARAFLVDVVTRAAPDDDPGERAILRRAAIALGWQGGPSAPEPLAGLLTHSDPDVRIDAALALGLTRLPAAAQRLRAHLPIEQDARVRANVERQLRAVEATLTPPPRP
jgi:HEAT repeat protein